jgi:hypothetical protein
MTNLDKLIMIIGLIANAAAGGAPAAGFPLWANSIVHAVGVGCLLFTPRLMATRAEKIATAKAEAAAETKP